MSESGGFSPRNGKVIDIRSRVSGGSKNVPLAQPAQGAPASVHAALDRVFSFKKRSETIYRILGALPWLITPNRVTAFRALLIIPIFICIGRGMYWTALAVFGLATVLDFVDGALAAVNERLKAAEPELNFRKVGNSPLGAFLDPLVDKVVVCGILISLLDKLHPAFTPAVIAVCIGAAVLTMVRVIKLAQQHNREPPLGITPAEWEGTGESSAVAETPDGAETASVKSVAAKGPGKLKLVTESAALILIIGGLALHAPLVLAAGECALLAAFCFAAWSIKSQLVG